MLITACGDYSELGEQQRRDLYGEAIVLLDTVKTNGVVNKENWKGSIAALEPESVVAKDEGVYIQTGSFFVTETGLFVPRPHIRVTQTPGADPSYQHIGNGLYRYKLKG